MNHPHILKWLVPAIVVLALIATLAGLLPGEGQPYAMTNFRGEQVIINGRGLYRWDTVNSAAQMQANDLVTLLLGLPLLAVASGRARHGSLRGQLLMTGTLGFILYTYITMCFGAAYNQLFLVYVALFGLSLAAFILSMMSCDLETLPAQFSERLPRRRISGLLFFIAAFFSLAWLGRIAATFAPNAVPLLENVTSMFIQAMDLGIVVPLCVLAGILLLRGNAWGYLLASVCLIKFLTLGVAVSLMSFNMVRVGATINAVELVVFPAIAAINLMLTVLLLRNVKK